MVKEYGGCLPLELKKVNTDFFPGFDWVALNSGRNAIAYAALAGGFKKVYVPYYTCKTVELGLREAGVTPAFYNIDSDFMPIEPEGGFDDKALFVYTNYFGIMTHVQQMDSGLLYSTCSRHLQCLQLSQVLRCSRRSISGRGQAESFGYSKWRERSHSRFPSAGN